jgi:hypothetical protein
MHPEWGQCARVAVRELNQAPHGTRDAVLRRVAKEFGLKDPNSVRRAIHAQGFLEVLQKHHREAYQAVAIAPLSVVERLSRWYRFDTDGALKAAQGWAQGKHTVRSIVEAMNAARPQGFAEAAKGAAQAAIIARIGGKLTGAELNFKDSEGDACVDYRFLRIGSADGRPESIAGLIVGPYQDHSLYRKRRQDWALRAFGLAWRYDWVALMMPIEEELEVFEVWISQYEKKLRPQTVGACAPHVFAVHLSLLSPEDVDALARMGS